jgi:hypothetical protein
MRNANAISCVAMFLAESFTGPGRQLVSFTPDADPDRLVVRGPLCCRWRAATDGTLRMEWENPSGKQAR